VVRVAGAGRRWTWGLLGPVAVCGVLAVTGPLGPRAAGAEGVLSATAGASGVATSVQDPANFPLGAVIEGDGPAAQAALTTTGQSNGFASALYPGSFALSLPGLLASQGAPELPAYPLYVESDAGLHRSDSVRQPGLSLTSTSSPDASTAEALAGLSSEQASVASSRAAATVSVDRAAGAVLAQATAATEVLTAGPLRIGHTASRAQAGRTGSSGLRRDSSLEVADMTVNGVTVGLTDHGLSAGGGAVPLPGDPIAQQLAQAGITVTYLAARDVPDGVVSPGLRIDVRQRDSGLVASLIVGQSIAVASLGPGPAFAVPPVVGSLSALVSGGPRQPPGSTSGPAGGPGAGAPAVTAPAPAAVDGSGRGAGPGALSAPPSTRPVAAGVRAPAPAPGTGFYLLIVVAAAAALLGGQLISWVGVRWGRPS